MFDHYKVNEDVVLIVRALNTDNVPVTNMTSPSVVTLVYPTGFIGTPVIGTNCSWSAVATGAWDSQGTYLLTLNASLISMPGNYTVGVSGTVSSLVVKAFQTFTVWNYYTADVLAEATLTRQMLTNKTVIAADSTYTVYADDGTTVLKVFDLKNISGEPSYNSVYQKIPR